MKHGLGYNEKAVYTKTSTGPILPEFCPGIIYSSKQREVEVIAFFKG